MSGLKKNKGGRPRKEIDKAEFESLCAIQCTLAEVQAFFDFKLGGCSDETIERWCKATYGKTFGEVIKEKKAIGRISLRRTQFRLAENNPTMAIFLGKNYLGQSDKVEQTVTAINPEVKNEVGEILNGLRENAGD